jgi:hypothetical protein
MKGEEGAFRTPVIIRRGWERVQQQNYSYTWLMVNHNLSGGKRESAIHWFLKSGSRQ